MKIVILYIINVTSEQVQWIVFAHFTLNETCKTLNDWGQGWEILGGYWVHTSPLNSDIAMISPALDQSHESDLRARNHTAEIHNIHAVTLSQWEASIQVTWSLSANQSPTITAEVHNIHAVTRSRYLWPFRALSFFPFRPYIIYAVSNVKFNWSSKKSMFVEFCYQQNYKLHR